APTAAKLRTAPGGERLRLGQLRPPPAAAPPLRHGGRAPESSRTAQDRILRRPSPRGPRRAASNAVVTRISSSASREATSARSPPTSTSIFFSSRSKRSTPLLSSQVEALEERLGRVGADRGPH